jgi:hypothetical protein
MHNPVHEEHESMKEWWGGEFDPRDFDLVETDRRLRKIKL